MKISQASSNVQIPTSETWHRDLLNLAVVNQIISQEVRDNIAEYMGFRHFFIHAYGFQLKYESIKALFNNIINVYSDFKSEIEQFLSNLAVNNNQIIYFCLAAFCISGPIIYFILPGGC